MTPLAADGRVAPGRVGIALLVAGLDPLVLTFKAGDVERLVAEVDRGLRMTETSRNDPAVHAALWRAVLDLARRLGRGGSLAQRERLGGHGLWLALHTPGGKVRRAYDALVRDGLAPCLTLVADAAGQWSMAIGPRFEGAAVTAAMAEAKQGQTVN